MARRKRFVFEDTTARAVAASAAVAASGAIAVGKAVRDRRAEQKTARSYRLNPGESPVQGIGRVARGQLDQTIELLDGRDRSRSGEAIHDARKALKRLRALLRLSRPWLDEDVYRRENVTFRDAGRALSGYRDAQVALQTLDEITARYGEELPDGPFARFRQHLEGEAHSDDHADPAPLLSTLSGARVRVAGYQLPDRGGPEALAEGLERVYRRGRRATRAAQADPDADHRHELRKRAKDLWHAAQLLRAVDRKRMRKLRRRAHRLSDLLGDDHDLAVLRDRALAQPDLFAPGELEALTALIARRQETLQKDAMRCASRVYRRKPKKLVRRLAVS